MSEIMVRERFLRSGKKVYEYSFEMASVDGKRKRKSKSGFASKRDARIAGRKALSEYENVGQVMVDRDISYADFLDLWMENDCKLTCKESTLYGYEKKIRLYLKPELGGYRVSSIDKKILQTFITDLYNDGFSINTIISIKGLLTKSFNYALEKKSDGQMSLLGTSDTTPNKLALEEVIQVIGLNNARHMKTSLKALLDKFAAAPYGFDAKDVQWLVAMLFKQGRVAMTLNSQALSLLSTEPRDIVRYLTKREFVDRLLIDIRERATDGQIRSAKEIMKDYFGFTLSSDDDDTIMRHFQKRANDKVESYNDILVEYRVNPKLPCKSLVEKAKNRLEEIIAIKEPGEFFKEVDRKRDDLLDDAEDTAPVFDFFKGDQRGIFETAVKNLEFFGNSKTYVSNQELLKVVEDITAIVNDRNPFGKIQKLPDLNKKFEELHMGLLEEEAAIMEPLVHDDFLKVKEVLDSKPFAEVLRPKINERFNEIFDKLKCSHDIAAIKNIKLESDTLKIKCLDEIDEYERTHQPAQEPVQPTPPATPGGVKLITPPVAPTIVKTKRRKNISITNVAGARTYSIENEQDIDKFLSEMKQKLMNELEEDTIITLS